MLANTVSPPVSGSVWMRRIEPIGGSGSQDTSECQLSPATRFDDSSAWMIMTSGCPSRPGSLGWKCSVPKRRPNAFCASTEMSWSRKKITPLSISASCTWANSSCVEIVTEVDALDHGADGGCEAVDGDVAGHDSSRAVFIGI